MFGLVHDPQRHSDVIKDYCSMGLKPAWYEEPFVNQWGLKVSCNNQLGRYLTSSKSIPACSVVMILLPVNIKHQSQMLPQDYNRAIQVSDVHYSCSESETEFNNCISHSCDPTCWVLIDENYFIYLVSTRTIHPEDPISFDYNTTEEDMVKQGVDFRCQCGSKYCKSWIRGRKYL